MKEYSSKITGPTWFINEVLPYCTILNGVTSTKIHKGWFRTTLTVYFDTEENRKTFVDIIVKSVQ